MKGIKKQHHSKMSPLSDLPRLHVAEESNMVAEMAELEKKYMECLLVVFFRL